MNLQASASSAISAIQSSLASATSQLALASQAIQPGIPIGTGQGLPIPVFQAPGTISLNTAQAVGIIIGIVLGSALLCLAVYLLVSRMRRKGRDSYLSDRGITGSPKQLPSRLSSTFRTGNSMVIRFNPPKSSKTQSPLGPDRPKHNYPLPSPSLSGTNNLSLESIVEEDNNASGNSTASRASGWPLTSVTTNILNLDASQTTLPPRSKGMQPARRISGNRAPSGLSKTTPAIALMSPKLDRTIELGSQSPARDSIPKEPRTGITSGRSLILDDFPSLANKATREKSQEYNKVRLEEVVRYVFEEKVIEKIAQPVKESFNDKPKGQYMDIPSIGNDIEGSLGKNNMNSPIDQLPTSQVKAEAEMVVRESVETPSLGRFDKTLSLPVESPQSSNISRESDSPESSLLFEVATPSSTTTQHIDDFEEDYFSKENSNLEISALPHEWEIEFPGIDTEDEQILDKTVQELLPETPTIQLPININLIPKQDLVSENSVQEVQDPSEIPKLQSPIRVHSPLEREPTQHIAFVEPETPPNSPGTKSPTSADIQPKQNLHSYEPVETTQQSKSSFAQNLRILAPSEEKQPPSSLRIPDDDQRDVSPLRRNPIFPSIDLTAFERHQPTHLEAPKEELELELDERRGRSMIRTSDIIEARLSAMAQLKDEVTTVEGLSRELSQPQPKANEDTARTTESILQPLDNPSFQPTGTSSIKVTSREESPLRRNPPTLYYPPISISDSRTRIVSRPKANTQFSKSLSKFQNLAAENPQEIIKAATEVTSRAIAGIYIPSSLREQAVRNVSRSRERGKSRAPIIQTGIESDKSN
jgi:hypothetical protein